MLAQDVRPPKDLQGQTGPWSGPQYEERKENIFPSPPTFFLPIGPSYGELTPCISTLYHSAQGAWRKPETIACSMAFHSHLAIRWNSTRMRASMQGIEAMLAQDLSLDCPTRVLPLVAAGLGGGSAFRRRIRCV